MSFNFNKNKYQSYNLKKNNYGGLNAPRKMNPSGYQKKQTDNLMFSFNPADKHQPVH